MKTHQLERDIYVFQGDKDEALATVLVDGDQALLFDCMSSRADGEALRDFVEKDLGAVVRMIVVTHYMSDHIAGLSAFPGAQILTHRFHRHTYHLQHGRSLEDDRDYVPPTIEITDRYAFSWGRHDIEIFHNPGKTLCALCADIAGADLLICGDAVVGNIVYLSSSEFGTLARSLTRLRALSRRRVAPGHMAVMDGDVFARAKIYLEKLGARVLALWREDGDMRRLEQIGIMDCLAFGVVPTAFETKWHGENLNVIRQRNLFRLGLPLQEIATR